MKNLIKSHTICAVVGAAALAATVSQAQTNLLTDPGFELQTAAPNPNPTGVAGWATFNGAAFLSTPDAHSGTWVLDTPDNGGGYGVPGAYQVFPATNGETFTFSGWVYTPNALVTSDNDFAILQLSFYSGTPPTNYGGGNPLGTVGVDIGDPAGTPPTNTVALPQGVWTHASITAVAPVGTGSIGAYILDINADANADFYFDDMSLTATSGGTPPPPTFPTNNAPIPTQPAANVLAMYDSSGVYPEVPVGDWRAGWSGSGENNFTIAGTTNVVLEYPGLTYVGVEFYTPDEIDVTNYNTMHVDIWTPTANQFGLQLVSLDAGDGTGTQAAQVNFTPASGTIVTNQWIGLNIPLTQFTNSANWVDGEPVDLSDVQQLLWIDNQGGGGVTGATFYIDNVYFYTSNSAPSPTTITASLASGSIQLAFATQNGFNYTVQYKAHLTDPTWTTLSTVSGNGSTQTVTDSPSQSSRFYRVFAH